MAALWSVHLFCVFVVHFVIRRIVRVWLGVLGVVVFLSAGNWGHGK